MKSILAPFVAGALITLAPLSQADNNSALTSSANITLSSDYLYRGISQTSHKAALQGGIDLTHESGLYLSTWASNVDFEGNIEIDIYGGHRGNLSEQLSYDVGVLYYAYPGDPDPGLVDGDFVEYYGSLSWNRFTLGVNYSNDFFAETGNAIYYYGSADFNLPQGFSLSLMAAQQQLDESTLFNGLTDSYNHYSLSLGREFADLNFNLTLSDTNLSEAECLGAGLSGNDCDSTLVFSVSKDL